MIQSTPKSQYFSHLTEHFSGEKKNGTHTNQMKSLIDYCSVYGTVYNTALYTPTESVFCVMQLCASVIIYVCDTISFVCISINYASAFMCVSLIMAFLLLDSI